MALKVYNEAPYVRIALPDELAFVNMYVDRIEERQVRWKSVLHLEGWAFEDGFDCQEADLFLVLNSECDEYVFKIVEPPKHRPDVAEAFGLGDDYTGFAASIARDVIRDGEYRVGLIIADNTGKRMYLSNQYLLKNENSITLNQ